MSLRLGHTIISSLFRPFLSISSTTSSTRKSLVTSKSSCEILWIVEAELADGPPLYVTGDPAELGGLEARHGYADVSNLTF
ncbi:hypothetical protein SAY87_031651 [Trapa incisa]|uniref:Uncharacterized protein n=1 Tax=Trapa incisa TaxID=236973 RepID=A0AAN7KTR0_9MYRT|nr:hypothetical protein SAY87_031651 [Trapa incisa]